MDQKVLKNTVRSTDADKVFHLKTRLYADPLLTN